ncbi:MAG: methylmalonyl-CoA epimerase [Anaerolineaceae bacterium]|nr:methylmalonyl-CoA epimerase [Anaerolineaceae bacterium]
MSKIKIDHLAVVVDDLDAALVFWRDALGLEMGGRQEVADEAVEIAFLDAGSAHVELVRPTTADSGIAKYLAKRGPGMHHICLAVGDIEAVMTTLAAAGIELINETPRTRDNGTRYAFVHPKSTGGVLVELYEAAAG